MKLSATASFGIACLARQIFSFLASAISLLCLAAHAQGGATFTTLVSFSGTNGPNLGAQPLSPLVQGADGSFYGTTRFGGLYDYGTVFQMAPDGTSTNLYCFAGTAADGGEPIAELVKGADGNFYGTTSSGGDEGHGTVFMISPAVRFRP